MGKDTMELISIAAATPGYVESFRYQDGGLERNVQDEFEARTDHIQVSRVVNWEIANEADYGLAAWVPTDSLLLYLSSNNLFVTEGLAYVGGARFLESGSEIFSTDDPATDTYYVYLKYTFLSDTFEYEYSTSIPTDTDLVKYLMLGTADWNTTTKFWTNEIDLRSSNTSLGAPATVSGSDAGAIFTVENTGAGDGLLVKNSDAVIGESGTPQQLVIQGDGTKALTIYNAANSFEVICSAADTMKIQTIAGSDAELIVKTLNGMVVASSIITTGEWQGTIIAKAFLAVHDHTAAGEGGDYGWADITGGISSTPSNGATTIAISSDWAFNHTALTTAHHTRYTDAEALLAVDEHIALESANATWVMCTLESWYIATAFYTTQNGTVWNVDGTDGTVVWHVPLATNRGSKKLYITGTRVSLKAADGSNYVTNTDIDGFGDSTYTTLDSDPTDKNSQALWPDTVSVDCSAYHGIRVELDCIVTTTNLLNIQFVSVRYYYA